MNESALRGVTWDHPRGIAPLLAASARFADAGCGPSIQWDRRPLASFEMEPIERLAEKYDLIAVDHPLIIDAVSHDCLVPMDDYLDRETMDHHRRGSLGESFASYHWSGRQWALPIDASCQLSAYGQEFADLSGLTTENDQDLVGLLRRAGQSRAALPLGPTHLLCLWFSMCAGCLDGRTDDSSPIRTLMDSGIQGRRFALEALDSVRDITGLVHPLSLTADPIDVLELMASGAIQYCPVIFGYSSYSRPAPSNALVKFGKLPTWNGKRLRSVLGGVGLAVSSNCAAPERAAAFASAVAGEEWQRGFYADVGGQPAHLAAWQDDAVDEQFNRFYSSAFETVGNALVRPRVPGYASFQKRAGEDLHRMLLFEDRSSFEIAEHLDLLWREVRKK